MSSIEGKLAALGLTLPEAPRPVGNYVPAVVDQGLVWVSGQTARINGVRRYLGKVGAEVSLEDGYRSARDAMLNCLAIIRAVAGGLDRVERFVKVVGYVNSAPGFRDQPSCLNGASDLVIQLFGERGRHARSAVGVAELPYGASVELEVVVRLKEAP